MNADVFNALVQLEAQQRAGAGASPPLPFIWIDWAHGEGFMRSRLVSPNEASRAAEHLTQRQWAWAIWRQVVMIVVVFPADTSQLRSSNELTVADLQPIFLHPSPLMLLHI